MEKKEAQLLFRKHIEVNSIIQLRDGKLMFYYFSRNSIINIYNEKTFKKLFEIDFDYESRILSLPKYYYKNNIKELYNGLILIGHKKFLIELKLSKKAYDYNYVKKFNDIILDINETSDKRIIIFTEEKIFILIKENKEYIIKEEYEMKNNWKVTGFELNKVDCFQFFSSDILPNNKLLLNSFSEIYGENNNCFFYKNMIPFHSKITFIDLNNFEQISSTDKIPDLAKTIILENAIIIYFYKKLLVYDINSLKCMNKYKYDTIYKHFSKYDNKYLLTNFIDNQNFYFSIFKIENNELIEYCKVENSLFYELYGINSYRIIGLCPFLFALKDKRIMIISEYDDIFLFKFSID